MAVREGRDAASGGLRWRSPSWSWRSAERPRLLPDWQQQPWERWPHDATPTDPVTPPPPNGSQPSSDAPPAWRPDAETVAEPRLPWEGRPAPTAPAPASPAYQSTTPLSDGPFGTLGAQPAQDQPARWPHEQDHQPAAPAAPAAPAGRTVPFDQPAARDSWADLPSAHDQDVGAGGWRSSASDRPDPDAPTRDERAPAGVPAPTAPPAYGQPQQPSQGGSGGGYQPPGSPSPSPSPSSPSPSPYGQSPYEQGQPGAGQSYGQSYGQAQQPQQPQQAQQPQAPGQSGGNSGNGGFTPPGSSPAPAPAPASPYGQSPYGQSSYGQSSHAQSPYGQSSHAQSPYGQSSYDQPGSGQPYGQPPQQPPQQPSQQPPQQPGGGYQPPGSGSPYGQGGQGSQTWVDPGGGGGWGGQPPGGGGGGGGWGGGPDPYGASPPKTDGKAIGALISAIVSFVFCPLILAIVALVLAAQASRTIRDAGGRVGGKGMVTAARIIAILNIFVSLIVGGFLIWAAVTAEPTPTTPTVTTASSSGGTESPTETTTAGATGTTEDSQELAGDAYDDVKAEGPGTCLNDTEKADVVSCEQAHDAELFAVVELDGIAYPGDKKVQDDAERHCRTEFQSFTGADLDEQTEYEAFTVTPKRSAWVLGQRDVACVLTGPSGQKLTGSARGALA